MVKHHKLRVAFRLVKHQCVESIMEWVSMAKHLHSSLTSTSAMLTVGCSGIKHTATGLKSNGDVFSGITNNNSLSGDLMVSGFGGCQENSTCQTAL